MYSTINSQTELLLSELVHTNRPVVYMGFGNVSKKSGSVDCGLFAIIDIAFGRDPSFHVYTQKEMRQHFFKCIEQKKLSYCFHLCQLKSIVITIAHNTTVTKLVGVCVSDFTYNISSQNLLLAPRSGFVNTVSSCHLYLVITLS